MSLPVANVLRNPGQVMDNVYFSESNLKVTSAKVLNRESYRFPLNSKSLGSTNTLLIPKNLMGSHILLAVEFQAEGWVAGYALPPGWGFNLVKRITYNFGADTLEVSGADNFLRHQVEAESDRKKQSILANAGEVAYFNGAVYFGGDPAYVDDLGGARVRAVIPIYAPMSSCNAMRQLPFDYNLLNGQANIRIEFETAENLWKQFRLTGDGAPAPLTLNMTTLSNAEFLVGQQELIDRSASKRDLVSGIGPNSNFQLNYYWYYPQAAESIVRIPTIKDDDAGAVLTSAIVSTNLQNFRNGQLMSIILHVERVDGYNSQKVAAQANAQRIDNQLYWPQMTDITLEYAGQTIYRSDSNKTAQAIDYMVNTTDSTYEYGPIRRGDANNVTVLADQKRSSYVRIQLSQYSEVFRDVLQAAGANLSNDSMQIRFRVSDNFNVAADSTLNDIQYRLRAQYVYSSSLSVSRGVGEFKFLTSVPQPQVSVST